MILLYRHRKKDERPDPTEPSSHTNVRHLSTPEKAKRIEKLHKCVRVCQQKIDRMRRKIEAYVEIEG